MSYHTCRTRTLWYITGVMAKSEYPGTEKDSLVSAKDHPGDGLAILAKIIARHHIARFRDPCDGDHPHIEMELDELQASADGSLISRGVCHPRSEDSAFYGQEAP